MWNLDLKIPCADQLLALIAQACDLATLNEIEKKKEIESNFFLGVHDLIYLKVSKQQPIDHKSFASFVLSPIIYTNI